VQSCPLPGGHLRGGAAFSSARNRLLAFAPLQGATRLVAHTEMSCVPTAVRRTAS
jgi:hypothetical protein